MKKLFLFLTLLFVGIGANAQFSPSNNLNYVKLIKTPPAGTTTDQMLVYDSADQFVKMIPIETENREAVNDVNKTITGTANRLIAYTAITADRTVTLPPATTANQRIWITDESGLCSNARRIIVIPSGADVIGGDAFSVINFPNGSGYLESNGAGKWNIISTTAVQFSSGVNTMPTITDNGNGSVTLGTGVYSLFANTNGTGRPKAYQITGGTFTFVDGSTNYIYADYNTTTGAVTLQQTATETPLNDLTQTLVYAAYRQGTTLHPRNFDTQGIALSNKINRSIYRTQRVRFEEGGVLVGESASPAARTITISAGTVWVAATEQPLIALTSAANTCYHVIQTSPGVWTTSTVVTQYNNTQYNTTAGLQTLNNNEYGVNWVYRSIGTDNDMAIVLGGASYTLGQAQTSAKPINLPPFMRHMELIGRIIVLKNATTATQIDNVSSTFFTTAGVTDHNALNNLQLAQLGSTYGHVNDQAQTIAGVKTFSSSPIVPTPTNATDAVNKSYADGLVVGLLDDRGTYNASSNLFPTTGGSGTAGAILKGDIWYVGTAGTLGGKSVAIGDSFRALVDAPGQTAGNWSLLSSNLSYVPANDANVVHLTGSENITGQKTFNSNNSYGAGLIAATQNGWQAIAAQSSSSGSAIYALANSLSTGNTFEANQQGIGAGILINNTGTGFNFVGQNNGLNTFTVNKLGAVTGTSFVKSGATSTNILLAGGGDIAQSTFATATGGTGYIQNQNASAQSANMWITGKGDFGGGLSITDNTKFLQFTPTTGLAGIGMVGSSSLDFYVGSGLQTRMSILQNGNVGIGTSTPSTDKVEILGDTFNLGVYRNSDFNVNGSSSSVISVGQLVGTTKTPAFDLIGLSTSTTDGEFRLRTRRAGVMTEAMRIQDNGNVLIGTTTDNGVDKLQVNGSSSIRPNTSGLTLSLFHNNTGSSAVPLSNKISWFASNYTECATIDVPDSRTNVIGVPMIFKTRTDAGTLTEWMRIANGGNVLIGTTTDNGVDKLQVNGNILVGNSATAELKYNSTSTGSVSSMVLRSNVANTSSQIQLLPNGTSTILPALQLFDSSTSAAGCNITLLGRGNSTLPNSGTTYLGSIISGNPNANSFNIGFLVSNTTDGRLESLTIKNTGQVQIAKLSGIGTRTVVADASGNLSATATPPARPYLVYTALLSQSGTSAPTATVLENTLGATISYSRAVAGVYTLTASFGVFTGGKTTVMTSAPTFDWYHIFSRTNTTEFAINSRKAGALSDDELNGVTLEIRVYP